MDAPVKPVTWLSGEIVTFINKIGAVIWLAGVGGALAAISLTTVRLLIAPVVLVLLATVFIFWLSMRVQRVGYAGRDLVVSNYLRDEHIPFEQVEAVEPVWWYYRRMVRIRLRRNTSFGQSVYYIPKWAELKWFWVAPEKELRKLLARDSD